MKTDQKVAQPGSPGRKVVFPVELAGLEESRSPVCPQMVLWGVSCLHCPLLLCSVLGLVTCFAVETLTAFFSLAFLLSSCVVQEVAL